MNPDAYERGYMAYQEGVGLEYNPFQDLSEDFDNWEAGWVQASDEDTQ